MEKERNNEHQEKAEQVSQDMRDERLFAILNHHRHNWLNDLQLIFGYIKLKKYDLLESYIEKLKSKLADESDISRIAHPSLALDLMFFRHSNVLFDLKFDIEPGLELFEMPKVADDIRRKLVETLYIFKDLSHMSHEDANLLIVQIRGIDEGISLNFEYNGSYHTEKFAQILAEERLKQQDQGYDIRWISDVKRLKAVIIMAQPL